MIAYASRTGTRRNLDALRGAGWRLLVSATGVHRHEGFRYAIDNGAWTAYQAGTLWNESAFLRLAPIGPSSRTSYRAGSRHWIIRSGGGSGSAVCARAGCSRCRMG